MNRTTIATVGMMITALVACSDDEAPVDPAPVDPAGVGAGPATTTGSGPSGGGGAAASTSGVGGGAGGADCLPTDAASLDAFLAAGDYTSWPAESAPHPSAGPHFGDVRTFMNDTLVASLTAGAGPHPRCSATVKELYGDGDTIRGHAVMIKTEDGTGGDTWFWYEVYDGMTFANANGDGTCVGCHSSGDDYVRTPFPLQ